MSIDIQKQIYDKNKNLSVWKKNVQVKIIYSKI